jgi:hypothetical protein
MNGFDGWHCQSISASFRSMEMLQTLIVFSSRHLYPLRAIPLDTVRNREMILCLQLLLILESIATQTYRFTLKKGIATAGQSRTSLARDFKALR